MPLTRLQLQQRIQQNLADAAGVYFDPTNVIYAMQDGYNEIVLDTECIEQLINLSWDSTFIYYDIYDLVTAPNYWKPTRMFNYATNRWLPVVDSRFLDKFRWDWEIASGTPWFAYVVNFQYIAFFPHYTDAASNWDLYYKVAPDQLISDNQLIQIPDPYTTALEYWCTADLLEAIQEFDKAQSFWNDFTVAEQALKTHVRNRMAPEFYAQLNDLQFPFPTLP